VKSGITTARRILAVDSTALAAELRSGHARLEEEIQGKAHMAEAAGREG
jgi:hypothetical protein